MGRRPKSETPDKQEANLPTLPSSERPEWQKPVRKVGTRYTSIDQLYEAELEYFEYCYRVQEVPTMGGLCLALGISRNCYKDWKKDKPEFYSVIESARMLVEYHLERMLVDPKYSKAVAGIIFSLKHNFGWHEDSDQGQEASQKVTFIMNIGSTGTSQQLNVITDNPVQLPAKQKALEAPDEQPQVQLQ